MLPAAPQKHHTVWLHGGTKGPCCSVCSHTLHKEHSLLPTSTWWYDACWLTATNTPSVGVPVLASKAKGLHEQEPMVGWSCGCVAGAKVEEARGGTCGQGGLCDWRLQDLNPPQFE